MTATFIVSQPIEPGMEDAEIQELCRQHALAGALRCWRDGNVLKTEWPVLEDPPPGAAPGN